jgi:holo-[acyl-carrier protein] synthase
MIFGIGTDVVEVSRIKKALEKYGDSLATKILNSTEFSIYKKINVKENFLAKRFAAKEAFAKALGTGFRGLVTFKSIEIINDSLGKPGIEMNYDLQNLTNELKIKKCHLSISDEKNIAVAFVVLEGE